MKFSSSAFVCASVLSVLLASPGVQAKRSFLFKEKLATNNAMKEDEKYWNRLMQESMSVAPTPGPPTPRPPTPEPETPTIPPPTPEPETPTPEPETPTPPPPTPEPETPTPPPPTPEPETPTPPPPTPEPETPTPPAPPVECEVDAQVSCVTDDDAAIDCNEITPDSENCMVDVVYSYVAENIGTNDMTITSAQSQFKEDTPLEVPILGTTLAPGETVEYLEQKTIDACANVPCPMTFEVEAESENGSPCMDDDVYVLDLSAPPTPEPETPPPTLEPETPPPTSPEPETPPPTSPEPETSTPSLEPETSTPSLEPETSTPSLEPETTTPTLEPETPLPTPPPTPEVITPEPTATAPTIPPTMAPTEECDIAIDVDCVPDDANVNATTCEALPPLVTICEQRPTWMQFKYYGGDCNQSANMQSEKFFCTDFAPIPQDPEAEVYLTATGRNDAEEIFFAGNVKINDLYNVTDPSGNRLPADMNLTVYESEGGTILQRVQYHSSCSQNLFLKDRYGASQLVAFFNELQGLVDCFITSNFTFTIQNNGTLPATLDSLVALTTPFGPFDLTDEVLAQEIDVGETFIVTLPVVIDLSVRQRYTVLATITGTFTGSAPCSSSDFLDFIAGNALPPSIPTLAPTSAPL